MITMSGTFRDCLRRRRFVTAHAAETARLKMGKEGAKLEIYRCPHCGQWHLKRTDLKDESHD